MKANLLVATPLESFGELIRQSLNDTNSFVVQVVKTKAETLLAAKNNNYTLALLDMELGEEEVCELGRALRTANPDMDLVIVSEEDLPPAMDRIRPWVLLRKPFYLPDFIQMIRAVPIIPEQFLNAIETEHDKAQLPMHDKQPEIPWLDDVSKAAQHLTRLTLESSAQAALITREKDLWAYAGQLSQNAANELAQIVVRHWDGQMGSDLLRFVRLEATKAEHMLYATGMTPDIILAMVFDAETPFSTIRNQANNLAQSLAVAKTGPSAPKNEHFSPVSTSLAKEQSWSDGEANGILDESSEDLEIPSIAQILEEVPPPIPPKREEVELPLMSDIEHGMGGERSDSDLDVSAAATRPSVPLSKPAHHLSQEDSPAIPLRGLTLTEPESHQQSFTDVSGELASTLPSKPQRRQMDDYHLVAGEIQFNETRPHSITEVAGRMVVESASAAMAQLNFACLLVPRLTSHYMTGDLADRIALWMPQICVAFGWRLEFLAVRPDYLQWVANVSPSTSPGYLMRAMRQYTSEKIFTDFPRLKKENPSGDFWAPGYLIMGGLQPHPPQLVKDYIKQIRQRQGISQPRR